MEEIVWEAPASDTHDPEQPAKQPIRGEYHLILTNQNEVSLSVYQSESSITHLLSIDQSESSII